MSLKRSREIAERLTTTERFEDFPKFCETYLKVLNRPETSMQGKVGETVTLSLNPIQLDFYEKIQRAKREGRPGRFIVLKARRMGLSTVTQALAFHQCLTNRDRRAFVTAVDRITTNNVFLMAKKMYDNLPSKALMAGGRRSMTPQRSCLPTSRGRATRRTFVQNCGGTTTTSCG